MEIISMGWVTLAKDFVTSTYNIRGDNTYKPLSWYRKEDWTVANKK